MGMTKLYGRGAITISDDRHTYRTENGSIAVPDHLVPRVLAHGFVRHAPADDEVVVATAEQAIGLGEHPQAGITAAAEARNASRTDSGPQGNRRR
jgi:hypothetical protein